MADALLAAVEGGGTSWVVAIASGGPSNIIERAEFPTTSPEETLGKCAEWLSTRKYHALGIASFGPVELHPSHPHYGYITTTPKPGWQYVDVVGPLMAVRPNVPVGFDTDVNAPAVAEHAHLVSQAIARGVAPPSSCAYITVGTGIGVGLVVNGASVHGLMHPEGGHLCVPRRAADMAFEGSNPKDCFGGLCAESMACSVALAKRASLSSTAQLAHLRDDDAVWDAAAHYLGALCANVVLLVSPERIILSGGIMQRSSLWPKLRARTQAMLNGYIASDELTTTEGIESYISPSTWGNQAGMVGALTLAQHALQGKVYSHSGSAAASNGGAGDVYKRGSWRIGLVVGLLCTAAVAASRSKQLGRLWG